MNSFNHVFHRRPTHTGVINQAAWSAHGRADGGDPNPALAPNPKMTNEGQ